MLVCKQIENEYGPVEWEIGAPGKAYTKWAAEMAVGLGTGVPWVMCKQEDAPDPIVSDSVNFFSIVFFHFNGFIFSKALLACFTFSVTISFVDVGGVCNSFLSIFGGPLIKNPWSFDFLAPFWPLHSFLNLILWVLLILLCLSFLAYALGFWVFWIVKLFKLHMFA